MKDISIIVPCYNEEEVLREFYDCVTNVVDKITKEYELLFVNDGSRDKTEEIIKEFAEYDAHVKYISFSRNFGKESAMYAGLENSDGKYTVIMDADLQHPPKVIEEMYNYIKNDEFDMIATRRKDRKSDSFIRGGLSQLFYKIMNKISGIDMGNNAMDFRMFNQRSKDAILEMSEYNRFSKGIFEWIGYKTHWLEIEIAERKAGNSKWSFIKLLMYSLEGCLAFSTLPLIISSVLGLIACFVAIIIIMSMLIQSIVYGVEGSGYATTICMILLMGGIQLLCIGILGQYLSKAYLEVKNRPKYLVSDTNIARNKDR